LFRFNGVAPLMVDVPVPPNVLAGPIGVPGAMLSYTVAPPVVTWPPVAGANMFNPVALQGLTSQPGTDAGLTLFTFVTTLRYTPAVVDGIVMLTAPLQTIAASALSTPPTIATPAAAAAHPAK